MNLVFSETSVLISHLKWYSERIIHNKQVMICLFVLRLNVPVNNFSVMSGRSHRFLVINQYFRGVKCLAQGHNTAAVGFEPPTSRSGVRHSTTEPPRSQQVMKNNFKVFFKNTPLILCTVMILSFRTDRSEQKVQTQIRLLLDCLPFVLHLLNAFH